MEPYYCEISRDLQNQVSREMRAFVGDRVEYDIWNRATAIDWEVYCNVTLDAHDDIYQRTKEEI